jgi:bifunctional UDP-N-acetylglucosamine pyrophosphorylase/glucosamine-1-phosphate N-acetyltransferase
MGKRMHSPKSKVLFSAAGRPLLAYPLLALSKLGSSQAVVVASPSNRDEIEAALETLRPDLGGLEAVVCVQPEQRGTGDAVRAALPALSSPWTLIAYGDGPLLLERDLRALCAAVQAPGTKLALLVCRLETPTGYGRVLLDDAGRVREIREERDLSNDAERATTLVNPGIYLVATDLLVEAIESLRPNNAQGEYYLTDIVAFARERGPVVPVPGDESALRGVNDRRELRAVEQRLFQRIAERHARAGVTLHGEVFIDDTVRIEPDAELGQGVVLRGNSAVCSGARIDVGSVVTDSEIGAGAWLKPYSIVSESQVGADAQLGPFAHLRPGSRIERGAHVGNFVETKKATLGEGAKANHLAYLGDVDVGAHSNIGAGTIVCNYDGFAKWRSTIGQGAFIGSDSQIVSPVTIGDGAYVATGSTVTADVPAQALAIARSRQVNKEGYAEPLRERLRANAPKK